MMDYKLTYSPILAGEYSHDMFRPIARERERSMDYKLKYIPFDPCEAENGTGEFQRYDQRLPLFRFS